MSACVQSSHVCQADSYLLSIIAEVQDCGRDPETRLREKFVLTIAPPVWCTESLYTVQHGYYRQARIAVTVGLDFVPRSHRRRMSSKNDKMFLYLVWIRQ